MIVLIRKWIAWLALAVVVAGASIYWAADEWQWGEKIEAMQVLSWNIIDDGQEETNNKENEVNNSDMAEDKTEETAAEEKIKEENTSKESENDNALKEDAPSSSTAKDTTTESKENEEELTENVIGSVNIDPSSSEVLNEQLTQTGVNTAANWQKEVEELKWQRQTQLAEEYDDLKYLAESAQTENVRTEAQERMLEIKNAQSIVQQAESMLKLKGYEAAVFVEGEQISAVVNQADIQSAGVAIAEILERTSGFAKENILVIPR